MGSLDDAKTTYAKSQFGYKLKELQEFLYLKYRALSSREKISKSSSRFVSNQTKK